MYFRVGILILLFVTFWQIATGQKDTTSWDLGGDVNLTFFQSSFSNWTDGGETTTTIGTLSNVFLKYKNQRTTWDNLGLLQYQIQKTDENPEFVKAIDRLEFLSVLAYNVSNENTSKWNYSLLGSLKTQLTPTRKDSVLQSNFFAPAEILIAPGMKYSRGTKKSIYNLLINFSPATSKFIIVNNDSLAIAATFTGEVGARVRTEFGASLISNYRVNIVETEKIKLTWQTNLELLSNYLENPLNIDIKWTNLVNINLFKYFSASLSTDLRYDDNVVVPVDKDGDGIFETSGPRTRFAQTFGVGIGYKF